MPWSCASNVKNRALPRHRQWSCVWTSSNQGCVGTLLDMRRMSGSGCDRGSSLDGRTDLGRYSHSDCHFCRIAKVGTLDSPNKRSSKEAIDVHGRICTQQSQPQFRCTFRDENFAVRGGSSDSRAWRLCTTSLAAGLSWPRSPEVTTPQTFCDGQPG